MQILKKLRFISDKCFVLIVSLVVAMSGYAFAAGDAPIPPKQNWSFNGIFGSFDIPATQRGLQVYTEVCSSCHGLSLVSFRHLSQIGFSEEEIKAYASQFTFIDGPDDEGEMFEREGLPQDFFVSPYPNQQAAKAANNNAYPKDLSLATKDSPYGADYLFALISSGYEEETPEGIEIDELLYYNKWMSGHAIAMPPPLSEGLVEYEGWEQEASVEQMAYDVVNFLAWASEPEMEKRKRLGLRVMIVLAFLTVLSFLVYRKIWRNVKH